MPQIGSSLTNALNEKRMSDEDRHLDVRPRPWIATDVVRVHEASTCAFTADLMLVLSISEIANALLPASLIEAPRCQQQQVQGSGPDLAHFFVLPRRFGDGGERGIRTPDTR
jgi:hypothetical protein